MALAGMSVLSKTALAAFPATTICVVLKIGSRPMEARSAGN